MLDFTNLPTRKKAYGGANGSKLSVVKYPTDKKKKPSLVLGFFINRKNFYNK